MDPIVEVKSAPVYKSLLLTIARNQVSKELHQQLVKILSRSKYQDDEVLTDFLSQLKERINTPQSFVCQLEKIHKVSPKLFKTLGSKFPELSRGEKDICILVHVGFNTGEIVKIRNSTRGATKMALFRIRKKLKLNSTSELYSFLNSIDLSQ